MTATPVEGQFVCLEIPTYARWAEIGRIFYRQKDRVDVPTLTIEGEVLSLDSHAGWKVWAVQARPFSVRLVMQMTPKSTAIDPRKEAAV